MENNFWKNPKDVLDDFELLSDFYDPQAQLNWNIMKNLPRNTRGRGTKLVESDTDEDEFDFDLSLSSLNSNQKDLKELDAVREYEVQDALRKACGIGYSNRIIESHWRGEKRDAHKNETQIDAQDIHIDSESNIIENTDQFVSSKTTEFNNEKESIAKEPKFNNEDVYSDINNEGKRNVLFRRTTYVRRPNIDIQDNGKVSPKEKLVAVSSSVLNEISPENSMEIKLPMIEETINKLNDFNPYYSDSSDENIIVETHELDDVIDSSDNTNNSKDERKKGNRKKYKPVDIEIGLPLQKSTLIHNEYSKIPSKPITFTKPVKSVLNPNAQEFHSLFSQNYDNNYKLASEKDFPPLS